MAHLADDGNQQVEEHKNVENGEQDEQEIRYRVEVHVAVLANSELNCVQPAKQKFKFLSQVCVLYNLQLYSLQ